ncbi:hypothetical protein [Kribbella sp. HUAS MG21]|uniref:DUF4386 family protein n=1 Tax=Kribbella sp. HUAS MG21 TaxID=3160966 RepID=A0AAU7T818_9ACTN
MTITTSSLTKSAGAAAAVAGAIFIGVQLNHPPADVAHIATTEMAVRETAKTVMAVLALAGFTGMFLRSRHRLGVVGLIGYLLLGVGYLALFAVQVIVACVLPTVSKSDPRYVQDVVDAATGGSPTGDIGGMQVLFNLSGAGYMLGGLLFGIALYRAGVLARWACALLAVATVSTAALAVLPQSFNRPMAVPTGVALIGLGVSLWRTSRTAGDAAPNLPAVASQISATPVR